MSHLTDEARAASRAAAGYVDVPGNSLEEIVAANPARRTILKNGLSLASMLGLAPMLSACGLDENDSPISGPAPSPTPTPTPTPTPSSFTVTFEGVAESTADRVIVPTGYVAETLLIAGAPGYRGRFQPSSETEGQAGGNHDGMYYFALPGVDANSRGLLAINHEFRTSASCSRACRTRRPQPPRKRDWPCRRSA